MNPQEELPELEEHLFKVLVVGDVNCGKTSIIKRYVHGTFNLNYKATIGVDFALKVMEQPQLKRTVRIQLWDIAGQERFGNMTRVYYREAVAAAVVYDQTREVTFEAAAKWKRDLDEKLGNHIPVVLFANKSDMMQHHPESEAMALFCKQHGFAGWFETSAKEVSNNGVKLGMDLLVEKLLPSSPSPPPSGGLPKTETIKLGEGGVDADETQHRSNCC